jgi:hypothetical protein
LKAFRSQPRRKAAVFGRQITDSERPPVEVWPSTVATRGPTTNVRTHENLQRKAAEVKHEWFVIDATDKVSAGGQ